jgi:hypothetical protein
MWFSPSTEFGCGNIIYYRGWETTNPQPFDQKFVHWQNIVRGNIFMVDK